ncbi:MAG: lipopolysaccharide biosynthesis protein [Treponema sp.]|nr:lipopolysaccharide biosynthesis protein [Treponema sp.]
MINILFCGNSKIFDGILTCMLSIFKRTETKEPFHFYIYTMDVSHIKPDYTCISDEQISFFDKIAKEYNPENIVEKFDVTDIYHKEFDGCPNEQCYCSPYTLIRLFADLVPNMPEKLLYLDVDMLLNKDITTLYNVDVTGVEYAASRDHYGKYLISPNFVNAGMLLLNMNEIKKTGLFKKSRNLLKVKKLLFADESAIIKCTTKKKMLAQKFNDQKFLHPKTTVIRHFSKRLFWLPYPHTANIKQWNVTKLHTIFKYEVFDDVLYEYIYLKKVFENKLYDEKTRLTNR